MKYLVRVVQYGGLPSELEWFNTLEEARAYLKGLTGEIYIKLEESE